MTTTTTPQPEQQATIQLAPIKRETIIVTIRGTAPLIMGRWSEKAIDQMRQKQFGQTVRPAREPKNPEEEAHARTYWCADGRPGMPATAFKAAMVGACRLFEGLPMTQAKLFFYVAGEGPEQLVPIDGEITMREDTPRNANGQPDLRYRNQVSGWTAHLHVTFLASKIDAASVVELVNAAGVGGVGEWRPSAPKSHTGTYGTWEVATA